MNTDRSLGVFAGQFVPLKLITDGNPQWSAWARKYPAEGRGIPYLYVVRADGEMLYGKSGSLSGAALPQMLKATLAKSGRVFSDEEVKLLAEANTAAEAALTNGDTLKAAAALGQVAKVGPPGKLNSFASHAKTADELAAKVGESATTVIDQAKAKLTDEATAFEGILALVEAEAALTGFPELRASADQALRDAKKNAALREPLTQAEALLRARLQASSPNAAVKRRAPKAYELIIERYPGTKADTIAREELAAIDPDSAALQGAPPATTGAKPFADEGMRVWTDVTGKFRVQAKLLAVADGKVQLEKADGETIVVPISRLSQQDQAFLRQR